MNASNDFFPPGDTMGVVWYKEIAKVSNQSTYVRCTVFVPSVFTFYDVLVDTTGHRALRQLSTLDWIQWRIVDVPENPPAILRHCSPVKFNQAPFLLKMSGLEPEFLSNLAIPDRREAVEDLGLDMAWSSDVGPVLILGYYEDPDQDEHIKRGVFARGYIKRNLEATKGRPTQFVVKSSELKYPEISPNDSESKSLEQMIRDLDTHIQNKKTMAAPPATYEEARTRKKEMDTIKWGNFNTEEDDVIDRSVPSVPAPALPKPQYWMKDEEKHKLECMRTFLNNNRNHVCIVYALKRSPRGARLPYIALAFCKYIGTVYMMTLANKSSSEQYTLLDWLECRVDYDNKAKICHIDQIMAKRASLVDCWDFNSPRGPALQMRVCLDFSKWEPMNKSANCEDGLVIHDHVHKVFVKKRFIKEFGQVKVVALVEHSESTKNRNPMMLAVELISVYTNTPEGVEDFFANTNGDYANREKRKPAEVAAPPNENDEDDFSGTESDDSNLERNRKPHEQPPGGFERVNGPWGKVHIRPLNPHPQGEWTSKNLGDDFMGFAGKHSERKSNEYTDDRYSPCNRSGKNERRQDKNSAFDRPWNSQNVFSTRPRQEVPPPPDAVPAQGFIALVTKKYAFIYCFNHDIAFTDIDSINKHNMRLGCKYDFYMVRAKPMCGAKYEIVFDSKLRPIEQRNELKWDIVKQFYCAFKCKINLMDDRAFITKVYCDQLGEVDVSDVQQISLLNGLYPSDLPERPKNIHKSQLLFGANYTAWMIPELLGEFRWQLFGIDDTAEGYKIGVGLAMGGSKMEDQDAPKFCGPKTRRAPRPEQSKPNISQSSMTDKELILMEEDARKPSGSSTKTSSTTSNIRPSANTEHILPPGTSEEKRLLGHIWSIPALQEGLQQTNPVLYDYISTWAQTEERDNQRATKLLNHFCNIPELILLVKETNFVLWDYLDEWAAKHPMRNS